MTKVVTIQPRYIIQNNCTEELQIRQHETSYTSIVKPDDSFPLFNIKVDEYNQDRLCIRLTGLLNDWSQPFMMNQIRRVSVKLGKVGSEEEDLMKVEILLEEATIFLVVSPEKGKWPFRIENESDEDIVVWQHVL